ATPRGHEAEPPLSSPSSGVRSAARQIVPPIENDSGVVLITGTPAVNLTQQEIDGSLNVQSFGAFQRCRDHWAMKGFNAVGGKDKLFARPQTAGSGRTIYDPDGLTRQRGPQISPFRLSMPDNLPGSLFVQQSKLAAAKREKQGIPHA